jgi:hypothetical protein
LEAKAQTSSSSWIGSPALDLIFFGFGWIPIFLAYVLAEKSGLKGPVWPVLLVFVLLINFAHRHLTLPLVYGDSEQFSRRPRTYIGLPIFFLVLTTATLLYLEPGKTKPIRPYFTILVFISVAWTIYHTLMQKMGILRIYSRKAGYGSARLDKAMVFSWFAYLFFACAASPGIERRAAKLSSAGRILKQILAPVFPFLPYIAWLALAAALVVTLLYFKTEWSAGGEFHWPKNIFLLSILLLYTTFLYDFVVGYAVFGFSHAIEYLAFVYIFTGRKYRAREPNSSWMARAVTRQALSFGIFLLAMGLLFLPWRWISNSTLQWYVIGSSFLHFIYDGWIWKVRDPRVSKPLGIATPAMPQV